MVTLTVALPELRGERSTSANRKEVESSAEIMELARAIEPPTCGLQRPDQQNDPEPGDPQKKPTSGDPSME
jgi:hypothetical protein